MPVLGHPGPLGELPLGQAQFLPPCSDRLRQFEPEFRLLVYGSHFWPPGAGRPRLGKADAPRLIWLTVIPPRPPYGWYTFTLAYADMKWSYASPNHRRSIAEALTDATEALLTAESPISRNTVREALRWSYSTRIRDDAQPPARLAPMIS